MIHTRSIVVKANCDHSNYYTTTTHKWTNGIRIFKGDVVRLNTDPGSDPEIIKGFTKNCALSNTVIGVCGGTNTAILNINFGSVTNAGSNAFRATMASDMTTSAAFL
jgi:hypothetical protein